MAFDYKKEYKEFYMPKNKPGIIEIPKMNYIAVRGKGNPNEENGEYKSSIGLLYGIAFTIKMSYKGTHKIEGFFEYVVPPLEGLWWQENTQGLDYARKEDKLSSIFRLKFSGFQLNHNIAAKIKVVEQKINVKIIAADIEMILIAEKRKSRSQL